MKRLRPAFVVTTCAAIVACSSEQQHRNPPDITYDPPPQELTGDATATPPGPEALRKRNGKSDTVKEWKQAGPTKGPMKVLHPSDASGRTIFVADDNACYIEEPKKDAPREPLPTGMPPPVDRITVDCPAIFDDPAWDDHRTGWVLAVDEGTKECVFMPRAGNPPPPNLKATCPASIDAER